MPIHTSREKKKPAKSLAEQFKARFLGLIAELYQSPLGDSDYLDVLDEVAMQYVPPPPDYFTEAQKSAWYRGAISASSSASPEATNPYKRRHMKQAWSMGADAYRNRNRQDQEGRA